VDGYEYNIRVRLPRSATGSTRDLVNIPLLGAGNRQVDLGSVADFETVMGPAHIERLNQVRIVRVNATADLGEATLGQIVDRVRSSLSGVALPDGYGLAHGGAAESIIAANREMRLAILLALFLVFVVLAVQYEKLSSPLAIIVSIPFCAVGVALALWLTGTALSAPVLLGMILLVGIVVNNAILLVDFADQHRQRNGSDPASAIAIAGAIRLRPVLMTTLTTIAGMTPLAIGWGDGGELMRPLALTVISGLAAGTLLTLVLLPCIYVILNNAALSLPGLRSNHFPVSADGRLR
jgi:multidrug efflux pump subunit AcrB